MTSPKRERGELILRSRFNLVTFVHEIPAEIAVSLATMNGT
jgi:hypothetical protein